MSEDKSDKQYEPTEQRLAEARKRGEVPRSIELNAGFMYIGSWLAFVVLSGFTVRYWLAMTQRGMGAEGWPEGGSFALARAMAGYAGIAVLGLAMIPLGAILISLIIQRALIFSGKKLAPDFNRLNPIKNAGQKFGPSGLVTFAISVGKTALVGFGGYLLFRHLAGLIFDAAMFGPNQWVTLLPHLLGLVLILAIAVSALFGGLDYLWKWFEHRRNNRMSRKEMEDEHKDSEGDPHLKAARRRKAIDIAMSSMLADVETADVIIVNPTHYAVALKWSRGSGRAPICVAKGVDELAGHIRERAKQHSVPIWSDPPCARAIHATIKIGNEITPDLFGPVAAAIRFAEKMRLRARQGWG